MENKESIKIIRDTNIVIAKQPDYIGVSKSDWARLKKRVNACKNKTNWWMNVGFTLFGISGSSLLSFLTIPIASESGWEKPTVLCVGIFTMLMGLICVIAHKREEKFSTSSIEDVKESLNEIDNSLISIKPE